MLARGCGESWFPDGGVAARSAPRERSASHPDWPARGGGRQRVGGGRDLLLPLVRHARRRRRVAALAAERATRRRRHRVELVPGARTVLVVRSARRAAADARDRRRRACRHVIVSWWGPGSAEAARLPARERGGTRGRSAGRVHVEPYGGRTPAALAADDPRARARRDHRLLHLRLDADPDADWRALNAQLSGRSALREHGPAGQGRERVASPGSTPTTSASTTARRSRGCAPRRGTPACSALRRSGLATTRSRATGDTRVRERAERRDVRPDVAVCGSGSRRRRHDHELQRVARGDADRAGRRSGRRTRPTTAPTGSRGARAQTGVPRPHGDAGTSALPRRVVGALSSTLVQGGGEPATVGADERLVGLEPLEERDRDLAQPLALVGRADGTASTMSRSAPSTSPASSAATTAGSSPLARSSSSRTSARGGASSSSRNASTAVRERAPVNSATTLPSRNAFTAGIPLTENRCERAGFASTSTLTSSTAPSRASTAASRTGASAWHGPHHSAQKSTSDRRLDPTASRRRPRRSTRSRPSRSAPASGRRRPRRSRRPAPPRRARAARRPASGARGRSRSAPTRRAGARARPRPSRSRAARRSRRCRGGRPGDARSPRARAAPRADRSACSSPSRCRAGSSARAPPSTRRKPSPRSDSVVGHAQIRAPAAGEQVELVVVRVRGVDDRRAGAEAARVGEQLDRAAIVLRRGTPGSRAAARRRGCAAAARSLAA